MKIWLHRISHHAEAAYPLIEKGYLTTGFSDMMNSDTLLIAGNHDWEGFEKSIEAAYGRRLRSRHSLWRFLSEMQAGDWVLVPSWGTFSVFQITGPAELIKDLSIHDLRAWNDEPMEVKGGALYVTDRFLDLGFFRSVTPLALGVSRYDFADAALTSRMKIRTTNADITDLISNVEKALTAFRECRPINLQSEILDETSEAVLKLIRNQLNPDKFERLIKWIFEGAGASVVDIPAKNASGKEGDADVVATFERLRTVYYVQAKLHTGETDAWAVQQIRDFKAQQELMDDGYSKIAWVVSTADSFSEECKQLATENSVGLFAGPDIAQMILETGIQNLDKAFL